MDCEVFDLVLYTIKKANEEFLEKWKINFGKTMIHKVIYFSLGKDDRSEYYKPYHYGPYSDLVQKSIGDLYYNGFIDNDKDNSFFISIQKGKENIIEKYLNDAPDALHEYTNKIDEVIKFVKDENLNVKDISIAGKINVINELINRKISQGTNNLTIKEEAKNFGWHEEFKNLPDSQIERYSNIASELIKIQDRK